MSDNFKNVVNRSKGGKEDEFSNIVTRSRTGKKRKDKQAGNYDSHGGQNPLLINKEPEAEPETEARKSYNHKVTKGASGRRTTSDKRVQLGTLAERRENPSKLEAFFAGTGKQLMGSQGSTVGTLMSATDNMPLGIRKQGVSKDDARLKDVIGAAGVKNPGKQVTSWADKKLQAGNEDIEYVKEGMNGVGKFAVDVANQGLLMGADALVSAIAPGLGQVSFATRAGGMGAYEARQEGASEEQQALYGAATGMMELGLERLFSAGKYLKGMYGQGALDIATPMASKVATSNLLKGITRSPQGRELVYQLTKAGFAMNEEGIEEALADLISPLLKRAVYADEIDMPSMGEVMYDYLVGAASGGLFGAAGTVADYKSGVGRMNQMQENGTMAEDMINRAAVQGEKTSAGQFAQQLSAQRDSGKEVLGGQLNDLQRMTAPEQLKHETELMRQKEEADRKRMAGDVSKFNRTGTERENRTIVEISSGFVKDKVSDVEKIVAENADLSVTLSGDSATFEAVAKVATGTATADDIDRILMKPAAKALVKAYTGVSLPVENTAARKSLENLVVFTGAEHRTEILTKAKAKVAEDMASSLGARGSAKFTEMYPNVNEQDNEKFYTVFKRFYNAGEYSMPIETVSKLVDDMGTEYQDVVSRYFTPEMRTAIHKAGFADSKVETTKNEERVIRHENIDQRAKKGAFKDHSTPGKLTKPMKRALTSLAKRTGVNIVFVDTLGESNGIYDNGTIYLAADADNPIITVAKHELTHYLKQYAPKEYQELEDFVFTELNGKKNIEKKIEQKIQEYAEKGHHLTRSAAKEEILADMAEAFFTDESAIDRVIAYSKELGEAILDGIRTILDTFLAIADADENKRSREYGRVLDEIGILRDAERLWMKALQASMKNDVVGADGEVKHSVKEIVGEKRSYGKGVLLDRDLFKNVHPRKRGDVLKKYVYKELAGKELVVFNNDVEEIVFIAKENDRVKKDGANNSHKVIDKLARNRAFDVNRSDAILHVDELMLTSSFREQNTDHNHQWMDEYGWEHRTAYMQEPSGDIYEVNLDIAKGRDRKILYDVNKIKKVDHGAGNSVKEPQSKMSTSKDIIHHNSTNINKKMSLKESDQEYITAVESGDMAKAQQMVDAAAERSLKNSNIRTRDGKLRKVYHGTNSDEFNVFDAGFTGMGSGDAGFFGRGFYFAFDKREAQYYGRNIKETYLNIKKPYNFNKELSEYDGKHSMDLNGSRATFVVNFTEKFPELAEGQIIDCIAKGDEYVEDMTFAEFAETFKRVYDTVDFKVEKFDGLYGTEYIVTADEKTITYKGADGKDYSYRDYGFQTRTVDEKSANDRIAMTYLYMEKVLYDYIKLPSTASVIVEVDFAGSLKQRGYDGVIQSEEGDEIVAFYPEQIKLTDPVTYDDSGNIIPLSERFNSSNPDIRYSMKVEDEDTLEFLNDQIERGEYVKVYRSFQKDANGNLYSPMNKGNDGFVSRIGQWEQATEPAVDEIDTMISKGMLRQKANGSWEYKLKAGSDTTSGKNRPTWAAYNPYLHASNSMFNDQFAAAYDRPNLVTVECYVPKSEITSGYWADKAKDPVGWAKWKAGKVSDELRKAGKPERQLFLSRWMMPVREVPVEEVAQYYKNNIDGTDIVIPWNVVPPPLREELERVGVPIDYGYVAQVKASFEDKFPGDKHSVKDDITITESETVAKHSLKSWNDTDKAKLLKALTKAGYSKEDAEKWMDDVNSIAAIIAADRDRLDYTPDEYQQMLRNNDEYYRTLDASTLCKKRLLYQGTYNAIQHRLPNTPLLPEDVIRIRQIMDEAGYEVPCGICYEESRKKHEGKFAERWLSEYQGDYVPTLDQVTTTDGRAWLRRNHPEVLESYLAYQRTRGSANPKVSMTRTDYRGDILNLHPTTIKNIKHIGGLRIQSFSDFETPHLIDMMQAIMDMSAKKLTSQAYTKVPAFARVFGGTGVKINLSLIGQVDKTGKLVFDDKEGMPHQEAFEIREMYPDNVGTILVGANEESILAAWADDRIDMVIPFHRSGWSFDEMERLGLGGYEDFTEYQSEKYLDDERGPISFKAYKDIYGKKMEGLYSDDYWDFSKTGKENAEAYLKLCAEQKRVPVFSNFLVDNGDGSWSLQPDGSADGYWKSLIDFKMYDNNGVGVPQKLVQPNFNMEEARKILEEYDEDADGLPVADDIVEQFVAEYKANNPRAKYQLKEGPSYDRRVETLEERVAYLKSEMKKTGLKTPVEKDTKVQASKLLKKYDSNMVLHTKLVDTMKDIFKIYKTADGDWYEAYDKAEKMARRIVDKIAILHDEKWQEYKELREHLKKVPIAISEADKQVMGHYGDFYKANRGRMKLVNGAKSNVSDYYSKLVERWPEKFTDDYTDFIDQLHHIEDVLDSLAPWYEHYSSRQMQALVTEIAEDIMVTTGELATRKTFADRKAEEKERAVDRVKRQRDAAMERMKERYDEKLIRQQKTSKEKMDAYKEKQKDRASRKKAMDRIQKNFDWLRERLLNPSDASHVPEGYRAAVAELLEGFDFETDRTDAYEAKNGASKKVIRLRAFKDRFRQIMEFPEGEAIELDPDFMAYMDEITDQIDGRRLSELDNVTLENVGLLLKQIKHQMSYINKCFNDDISEGIHELGESTIWEANEQKEAKEYTSVKMHVNRLLNESMVTPADMFELIGGAQKKLYQAMRNGFDRHVQNVQMAIQFTQTTIGDAKVKDWSQNKHTFTLESGKVEMTTTQLMTLYALMQREQAQGHILGSGIVMAPIELKVGKLKAKQKMAETHVMPTLEEVLEMVGVLTDEQRRIADEMRGFLSNECSEWGNRTSMKLYGYRKFTEKDYFPIKSSDSFLNENFDQKNVETSLKSMGFTKAVVREASNPIVIDDFFTVFTDHVNKMSMYEALVPAMTDFQRVYNYKQKEDGKQVDSVQKALKRAYGTSATSYIKQFMEDLNGSQRTRNDAGIATSMISTYKKASIGGNLRVLLQQPTSLVRAFAVINPKYFSNTPATKKDVTEMKEHCSIAQWKSYGFYNTDVARDMKDIMMGESNLVDDVFMGTYGKADDWTWANIWKAVKKEVEAKNPNLEKGSDEYWQKVNERASYVYDRTQVVDSVFHRSQIMRNKGTFEKMLTSFMAEPTKTYNLLRTEIITAKRELTEGKKKEATKRVSGILGVYLMANMTTAMAAAIADAMRGAGGDDEEDKGNFGQRWWAHSIANFKDNANPLNMIPLAKDVVSMYSGYDVARMDMQGISKLLKVQSMWEGLADGSSKYTYGHVIRTTAETMSYFTGVPVKNFLRDVEGITKTVAEAFGAGTAVKFQVAKWTYTLSEDSKNRATFADLYYDALAEGDRALANEILHYMRSQGVTEKYIKNRKKTWSEHNTK